MPQNFHARLHKYFEDIGSILRGESKASSIFPNTSDVGVSREKAYAEVLRAHLPSNCNVKLGGFVFGVSGDESRQIDIIISNDKSIQFNFLNRDDSGKSFSCIDGCIGVVSVKSTLDKQQLLDSLENLASLPKKTPIGDRSLINREILNYSDWPYKTIFASDGLSPKTILEHLNNFYLKNPEIPQCNRPNFIHVCGKYNIIRSLSGGNTLRNGEVIPTGSFHLQESSPDVFGILHVISDMQAIAMASNMIAYTYSEIINNLPEA